MQPTSMMCASFPSSARVARAACKVSRRRSPPAGRGSDVDHWQFVLCAIRPAFSAAPRSSSSLFMFHQYLAQLITRHLRKDFTVYLDHRCLRAALRQATSSKSKRPSGWFRLHGRQAVLEHPRKLSAALHVAGVPRQTRTWFAWRMKTELGVE